MILKQVRKLGPYSPYINTPKVARKMVITPFWRIIKNGQNRLKMAFLAIFEIFSKMVKIGSKWLFGPFLRYFQKWSK